ncbi:MAG: phosphonate ABC transporter ATP-binding protein [Planctomycetota bacterium]
MIEIDNVSVTYAGEVHALREVSLTLRDGEFTVLLGHSGAGKSTLLRALNYLQPPTAGQIRFAGTEIGAGPGLRLHRRRTAMIFQLHQLIARQSALQNVLLGRIGYYSTWRSLIPFPRADVDLALTCLDRVGLLDKAESRCDALSGGERQRVGIARALCQKPETVLADEPVASLDPVASRRVLDILRGVCSEDGLTAVVSLHQVEFAREFGERIIGLQGGRVVFDGPPADLTDADLARIYPSTEPTKRTAVDAPETTSQRRPSHGMEACS